MTARELQAVAGFPFPWGDPVFPDVVDSAPQRAAELGGFYLTASQTITLSSDAPRRADDGPTLIQVPAGQTAVRKFSFFIDGVDRSEWVNTDPSPTITAQVNSKFTANFRTIDISGAAWTPTEGDPVKIYEGTTLQFNGWITRT